PTKELPAPKDWQPLGHPLPSGSTHLRYAFGSDRQESPPSTGLTTACADRFSNGPHSGLTNEHSIRQAEDEVLHKQSIILYRGCQPKKKRLWQYLPVFCRHTQKTAIHPLTAALFLH